MLSQENATEAIDEFNRDAGRSDGRDCLFVWKLRRAGLNNQQIVAVIVAIETTCPHCYDASRMCRCNDDT